MAGDFLEAIGKLTVFVICAQILVYFRPKQVYEKYMKLLMNLLILLQLMLPIGNLLRGGSELDLRAKYESFQSRLEEYMEGTAWRVYDGLVTEESRIPEKDLLGEDLWYEGESRGNQGTEGNQQNQGTGGNQEKQADRNNWDNMESREGIPGDFIEAEQDVAESPEDLGMIERVEIPAVELGGKDER